MPPGLRPRRVIQPAEEMWLARLEVPEIAALLGYSASTIYTQLRAVGIHARDRQGGAQANRAAMKARWGGKRKGTA